MQNTKTNEQKAQEDLAHIALSAKRIETMRERLSIIEYGMLKDIEAKNPDFDFHAKAGAMAQDESEKKELVSYLGHVVPVPIGFKQPAASMNASKMQERIYKSTKYLQQGGRASDEKVEKISESRKEMSDIYNSLAERLDKYAKGTPDKTMINPKAIQDTIDAGGDPFKKTESLVLYYGVGDGSEETKAFAVTRTTGNQGEYPSYNFPNNGNSMSIVKGNITTANKVIVVSGDLYNQALKEDADKPHKSAAVTDDLEAAALAYSLNLNSPKNSDVAMVVADTRSLKTVHNKITSINPNAQTVIYTDNQVDRIYQTLKDGSENKIESSAAQAILMAKDSSKSEALSKKHGLWLKPVPASLHSIFTKLKDRASEQHPDNEYQAKEQYRSAKESIAKLVEAKGLEQTDALRKAFTGKHLTSSEDLARKAERDSRLNARINPDARSVATDAPIRPAIESVRETIAPSEPESPRIAAPTR